LDLIKIVYDLRRERSKLEAIIASLEQLKGDDSPSSAQTQMARRGRRSMDAAGRLEVSRRMKQYWENRRKQGAFEQEGSGADHSEVEPVSV
jgi:hypothetical protein